VSSPRLLLGVGLATLLLAQPAPAADSPKLGKTALLDAVSGTVEVMEKGKSGFERLGKSPELIRMGSVIDATRGKVRIRAAANGRGLNEGTFWRGEFEVSQHRRDGVTDAILHGDGGDACTPVAGARLWAESDDAFRTLGWFSGATAEKAGTSWLTEDLCEGTRTTVRSGRVQASAGPVLVLDVFEGATVQHFCDLEGADPVSRAFCTMLTWNPGLGLWGSGLANRGDATSYDLCITDPSGEESCTNYPLSAPFGRPAIRDSVVGCYADGGPGAYSLRWLIDGVQLGPAPGFTSNTLAGQGCVRDP
jgi:hypothetical protein